jgi:parallel beta-helix repeat protein
VKTLFRHFHILILLLVITVPASAQLSGTFTIGPIDADYPDFSAAVADLNESGVSGPVVFNVQAGIYTEQILITADGTSTNTITFQSASGNASDVVLTFGAKGAADNYVVYLWQTSYVTFQNMTFTATGTDYGYVFLLDGALNSTIMNSVINGVATTSYTPNTKEVIIALAKSTATNNTLISGNTINDGSIGIFMKGSSLGIPTGTRIENNTVSNQYWYGIWVNVQDSPVVNGNTVETNSANDKYIGIRAEDCDNDLEIRNNRVNLRQQIGIHVRNGVGTSSNTGLVANNFVRMGDGSSSSAIGIEIENATYLDVYHNTVSINSSSASFARAFWVWGTNGSNINVVNNIFSSPNSKGYAYYLSSGAASAIAISDYNNFDANGSGRFSHWDGTDYTSLSAFQAASNTDGNSVVTFVTFADAAAGDLHLSGESVGDPTLTGTSLSSVTDDIDGDPRNPSTPYMGADEAETPLPVELTSFTFSVIANDIYLKWTTATETNNFGFEVQRRNPNTDWQRVGFEPGHGTTVQPQNYEFTDADLPNGRYLYRLKQIDTDGRFEYSQVLAVTVGQPVTTRLRQNYPNPFNPSTNIIYSIKEQGLVTLKIYDALGRLVKTLVQKNMPAGEHSLVWKGKDDQGKRVATGTYFYSLRVDDKIIAQKRMLLLK